jgi:integrase
MGTIIKRKRKDGTIAFRAEVRVMKNGVQILKQTKTFDARRHAERWMRETEEQGVAPKSCTVGELVEKYMNYVEPIKPMGRTRKEVYRALIKREKYMKIPADELTVEQICDFCRERRKEGAGPATVIIDFGAMQKVFSVAKPLLGVGVADGIFKQARPILLELGLIGKPKQRNRRVEGDEFERLLAHFRKRIKHQSSLIPMADIVEFAAYTAMRQGEICRIRWADLNEDRRTVIIRDRKDPKKKEGNDQEIPLFGPAWEIVERQPRLDDRIFPYDEKSVSAAFTRSCQQLGIENLRFHDLRREGASRLMEMGFSVAEVASITGHRDLNILWQVYTKINPETLHAKYKTDAKGG